MSHNQTTVLYVEDEAIIALSQRRILERHGFTVVHATSGEQAVTMARTHPEIGLVIMDIDLGPGIDGTEAAEQILAERDLPLIFLTSHSSREYVERVKAISNYGYVIKNSGEFVLIQTIESAFALHDALTSSRALAGRNEEILKAIPDMVIVFNRTGFFVDIKGSDDAKLDRPPEQLIGKHVREVLPVDLAERTERRIAEVLESRTAHEYDYELPTDQGILHRRGRMVPYGDDHTFTIDRDITPVYQAEASAAAAQTRVEVFADVGFEGIVIHDHGTIEYVNRALCDLTGYTEDDFIGKDALTFIHPDDREIVRRAIADNSTEAYESRVIRKDGTEFFALLRAWIYAEQGVTHRIAVVHDITDSKRTQQQLETQVTEMRQLVTEVQHRIKNNFASIESLLTLKASAARERSTAAALIEARASVTAGRVLYERLLEIQTESEIDTSSYIRDIAQQVLSSFDGTGRIAMQCQIDAFPLDAKRAFPLATLLTELITNAIKYAYPGSEAGTISVSLVQEGTTVKMEVRDAGAGFDTRRLHAHGLAHLGLNLSEILAGQLGGTFAIESTPNAGTTARVEFPYSDPRTD